MDPMYLPSVENDDAPNAWGEAVRAMKAQGVPVPQIRYLLAFKPHTRFLEQFTQGVMRGPSPLSPGMRELIAAFTSKRNECPF